MASPAGMRVAGRVLPRLPHFRPPQLAVRKIAREVAHRALAHNLVDTAAGAAFWLLLAIFPFVFFAVSIITLALGRESIDAMVKLVLTLAPGSVQQEVEHYVHAVLARPSGNDAIVALVIALWSASGGAVALGDALNRAEGIEHDQRGFWKRRLQAATAVGLSTLFLAVAVVFVASAPKIVDRVLGAVGLGAIADLLFRVLRWPAALIFAVLAWSLAYRALPFRQPFTLLSPGALVGIPLWGLASVGFSFYVAHFGDYGSAYGSLGGAVVFLLWCWLSTLILLVGGEVNAVVRDLGGRA